MHRIISWFVDNSVAANLLMWILLIGGAVALMTTHQEEFPNIDTKSVSVNVPYLGAAPEEAEQGVCIRIEEAVKGTEGIDWIQSTASEGGCSVGIILTEDVDSITALNEIKSKIDGISTFPAETEKPIVSRFIMRGGVLQIAIAGNASEGTLKRVGQNLRDDIAALDGVSQVELDYVRPYEISIEVSEYTLRKHGITLTEVANAIRRASLDMPGGSIKTAGGEILLRTKGQAYRGEEFEDIVVLTRVDGTRVTVGEIANVVDGFQEGDLAARFDGKPAVMVKIYRVGEEDILAIADKVQELVIRTQARMPPGIDLVVWMNQSQGLVDRMDTLVATAIGGLGLVLLTLTLFLKFGVAIWVAAGIPIALAGALMIFPYAGISISTMAILAFILVLGIVVDDAIVVGERIYAHEQLKKSRTQAAVDGAYEVSIPVIFGVLTTVAAFLPLIMVEGRMSQFFSVIGWIVILALIFSIIESQMILPVHLSHRRAWFPNHPAVKAWNRFQDKFANALTSFAADIYRPFLLKALWWRYVTAAVALGILVFAIALIVSGRVVFQFFPSIEGDRVYATLTMPEGVMIDRTLEGVKRIEAAVPALREELDAEYPPGTPSMIKHMFSSIGTHVDRGRGPSRGRSGPGRSHFAEVAIELQPAKVRGNLSSTDVANRWRELVGSVPDAVELKFSAADFSAGDAINIRLMGRRVEDLRAAAAEVRAELSRFNGVKDITDSFRSGKQEIKLKLLPEARNLGLTLNDLGRQVRQAFYGEEAQRIQRDTDDVRVMVRYPESERRSIGNLEDMRIRTADGTEVPFASVATFDLGRGYSSISRIDGQRVVSVIADVDRSVISPEEVLASFRRNAMPEILKKYPGVKYKLAGEQEERNKAMVGLASGFIIALFMIYALLAIPLRSYLQPLVIMSVIPFGAIGAIVGHFLMSWDLMFFSMLGIVALSGVVVNASLVLVDFINRRRREGIPLVEAVTRAGVVRFRPIILTSVTTFVGLIPLMATANPATAFFIPMAISLAFGVLFATVITLVLVPALYLIVEDGLAFLARIRGIEHLPPKSARVVKEAPGSGAPQPTGAGASMSLGTGGR